MCYGVMIPRCEFSGDDRGEIIWVVRRYTRQRFRKATSLLAAPIEIIIIIIIISSKSLCFACFFI